MILQDLFDKIPLYESSRVCEEHGRLLLCAF